MILFTKLDPHELDPHELEAAHLGEPASRPAHDDQEHAT